MDQTSAAAPGQAPARGRRLAKASLWMLAVFVAWTVAFSFGTALLAEPLGLETEASGEVAYIEGWVPWIAATLAWVWPPVVGIVLALMARAHSGGRLAWVALALNAGALIFVTVPSLVDRLIHL